MKDWLGEILQVSAGVDGNGLNEGIYAYVHAVDNPEEKFDGWASIAPDMANQGLAIALAAFNGNGLISVYMGDVNSDPNESSWVINFIRTRK